MRPDSLSGRVIFTAPRKVRGAVFRFNIQLSRQPQARRDRYGTKR